MGKYYFKRGVRFKFNARICCVIREMANRRRLIEYEDTGETFVKTTDELTTEFFQNQSVKFELGGPNLHVEHETGFANSYSIFANQFIVTEDNKKNVTHDRYTLMLPLIRLPEEQRTRQVIEDYIKTLGDIRSGNRIAQWNGTNLTEQMMVMARRPRPPSQSTVTRWLNDLTASGNDIRSLVPRYYLCGNPDEGRLGSDIELIIQEVLEKCVSDRKKRTTKIVTKMIIARVYEENQNRPPHSQKLQAPSFSTVYRRIHSYGSDLILRRQWTRLEKKAKDMSESGPKDKLTRILERVEIDCTLLDLHVVHPDDRKVVGRPTLVIAIDAYSRFPLGFYLGFEPPSYLSVMTCLYHAICPKPDVVTRYETKNPWHAWGIPEVLITDNGKEFINKSLTSACEQLGIILEQMPVATPWFKGIVERFIGGINQWTHSLAGTSYSSSKEKGDYDPLKHASLSLEALTKAIHIFLLDRYAQETHSSINTSPAKRWAESEDIFEPALCIDAETLRITLLASAQRTIQRIGIEFESLTYYSPELVDIRTFVRKQKKKEIYFKYDPGNLGTIYVSDPIGSRTWIAVPAVSQSYAEGLSLHRHKRNREQLLNENKRVDGQALADTDRQLEQLYEQEANTTKKATKTRKRMARLQSGRASTKSPNNEAKSPVHHEVGALSPQIASPSTLDITTHNDDEFDLSDYDGGYNLPV